MTIPADSQQWRIGLVGYGEVGRILAEDLRAAGLAHIAAYDLKLGACRRCSRYASMPSGTASRSHASHAALASMPI